MATTIPGLENPPTRNKKLLEWVEEVASLTQPDRIEWADGSDEEWDRLTQLMVDGGTFIRLDEQKRPNSFLARSNPSDVARAIATISSVAASSGASARRGG